jgi:hypothetical protein
LIWKKDIRVSNSKKIYFIHLFSYLKVWYPSFSFNINYRGATKESINAFSIYKFRLKRTSTNSNRENSEIHLDSQGADGVGIIGAGTDKEHMISAEDAVSAFLWMYVYMPACMQNAHMLRKYLLLLFSVKGDDSIAATFFFPPML